MSLIAQLRSFDIDRLDVDEAVALSSQARALEAEYESFGAEMDERLREKIEELRAYIRASQKAMIQKRVRELKARRAAMLPKEEKLKNLDADIAALEAKL